jgi:hypothetical protein
MAIVSQMTDMEASASRAARSFTVFATSQRDWNISREQLFL